MLVEAASITTTIESPVRDEMLKMSDLSITQIME
jgi:hypothetical protein